MRKNKQVEIMENNQLKNDKFQKAELELNKSPNPIQSNISLLNANFVSTIKLIGLNSPSIIKLRIVITKDIDNFGILEDDKYVALVDVVYNVDKIKNLELENGIDFTDATIKKLILNENGDMVLNIENEMYKLAMNITFSFKSYNWIVFRVITKEEYDHRLDNLVNAKPDDSFINITNLKRPEFVCTKEQKEKNIYILD